MGVGIHVYKCPIEMYMGYYEFERLRCYIQKALDNEVSEGTISFLTQDDCLGRLTPKQSRELLEDIKSIPDDGAQYGYACWERTLSDFREMLRFSAKNRRNLRWS